MENQEFSSMVNETFDNLKIILTSKGHDYANEDALANLKTVSELARILGIDFTQPHHYPLLMVLMKFGRLQNLTAKGADPKNESVADTVTDAIGYMLLTKASLLEGK